MVHRKTSDEDVTRDERVGDGSSRSKHFEDSREYRSAFSIGKTGTDLVEVSRNSLKPEAEEGSVRLLVLREVVEREVEDRVQERSSRRRGRSRREESDKIGKRDRSERLASHCESGVGSRGEGSFGDEVEGRGEMRSRVVGKEEGDESWDVEILYPVDDTSSVSSPPGGERG